MIENHQTSNCVPCEIVLQKWRRYRLSHIKTIEGIFSSRIAFQEILK